MKLTIYTTPAGLEKTGIISRINKEAKALDIELSYVIITRPFDNYIIVDKDEYCYRIDPTIIMRDIKLPNEIAQITQGELLKRSINILTNKLNITHANVCIINAMDGAHSLISTGMDMYTHTYALYPEVPKDFENLQADVVVNFGVDSPKVKTFPKSMKGYVDFTSRTRKVSTDVALISQEQLDIIDIQLLFEKLAIFDKDIKTVK